MMLPTFLLGGIQLTSFMTKIFMGRIMAKSYQEWMREAPFGVLQTLYL